MTSRALFLTAASTLLGCSFDVLNRDDTGASTAEEEKPEWPEGKGPLDPVELCALYLAQDMNQGRVGSDDPGWVLCMVRPTSTGLDFSDEALDRACRPGTVARKWADDLLLAEDEDRLYIDWPVARECYTESRALRTSGPSFGLIGTEAWEALRAGPCKSFYEGLLDDGEPCTDDWDCAGETSGCYTDDKFDPTKLCLAKGSQNDACDDTFHPCGEGLRCSEAFTCAPLGGANAPCSFPEDCLSGVCIYNDLGQTVCGPVQPNTATPIGEVCETFQDCRQSCVGCRPLEDGGPLTCQVLGGEGAYCRDWFDCVLDLGCVHSVCSYAARGQDCAVSGLSPVQGVCAPDLVCLPDAACTPLSEGACGVNPRCTWVPPADYGSGYYYEGYCAPNLGTCEILPESGDCLAGLYCAAGAYCATSGVCRTTARQGEPCSQDGYDEPICDGCDTFGYCYSGLWCTGGTCEYACEMREDCDEDEFCDTWAVPPSCEATNLANCDSDDSCPADHYCLIPAYICYDHDGDQEGCEAESQCEFDATSGYCDPASSNAYEGKCKPKIETGEACSPSLYGADCASTYCSADDAGDYRCEVFLDSCSNNNKGFLHFAFLFGLGVWRLKKRRA